MRFYAEIYRNLVQNVVERPADYDLSLPWQVVDVTDVIPRPQSGWTYDPTTGTFSPSVVLPTLELKAYHPTNNPKTEQSEIFRMSERDLDPTTGNPQLGKENRWAVLNGRVLASDGSTDTTANHDPVLIEVQHPRGEIVVAKYRVKAGIVEMEMADGWVSNVPFWSRESGLIDIGAAFDPYFTLAEPFVITVKIG